jgi:hypothetical protein
VTEKKKKGGARPGCGRKKRSLTPPAAIKIDARGVAGQSRAAWLIDELNSIDPEIMEHCALMVSVEPLEIPDDATKENRKELEKLEARRRDALALRNAAEAKFQELSYEVQGWALLWFAARTALETRKHLYDKADGKAMQTVNHLHDKPIEHNVTLSLGEGMKLAMERADERLRNHKR